MGLKTFLFAYTLNCHFFQLSRVVQVLGQQVVLVEGAMAGELDLEVQDLDLVELAQAPGELVQVGLGMDQVALGMDQVGVAQFLVELDMDQVGPDLFLVGLGMDQVDWDLKAEEQGQQLEVIIT